jgi:hypothetical protein
MNIVAIEIQGCLELLADRKLPLELQALRTRARLQMILARLAREEVRAAKALAGNAAFLRRQSD